MVGETWLCHPGHREPLFPFIEAFGLVSAVVVIQGSIQKN